MDTAENKQSVVDDARMDDRSTNESGGICKPSLQEGIKYDDGKYRWDLLPWSSIEEVVKVYHFGAIKYEAYNWQKGIRYSRLIAAMWRHFYSWMKGEYRDEESGVHPLAHVAWICLTLIWYDNRKREYDDREAT